MSIFDNSKWIVTIQIPHFGSTGTIEFLKFLSFKQPIETSRNPSRGLVPVHRIVKFEFSHEYQAMSFTNALDKTFHPKFLTHTTEKDFLHANPWDQLEAMVKGHDLYHQMSDDHRVWQSGQAELRAIENLANKLAIIDKERVRDMVKGIFKLIP